jgi:hypothetical protein
VLEVAREKELAATQLPESANTSAPTSPGGAESPDELSGLLPSLANAFTP